MKIERALLNAARAKKHDMITPLDAYRELPEIGSDSPWGPVQHLHTLGDGIVFVHTAGHGGVWLSTDRLRQVPKEMLAKQWLGGSRFFEEDCDWCIPYVVFEEEIKRYALEFLHDGRADRERDLDTIRLGHHFTALRQSHPAAWEYWMAKHGGPIC